QDAAKLSTGIKLAHYRDTLRQLAFGQLQRRTAGAVARQAERRALSNDAAELLALEQRNATVGLDPAERSRREALLAALPPDVVVEVLLHATRGGAAPQILTPPAAP